MHVDDINKFVNIVLRVNEALAGVWENMGTGVIISGEQGNKGLKVKETGKQRQFLEKWEIQILTLSNREQSSLFQGNKGTGTPWEGPRQSNTTLIQPTSEELTHCRSEIGCKEGKQLLLPLQYRIKSKTICCAFSIKTSAKWRA